MPTLGASLDFAKLEARNMRNHQLGVAPAAPVTGQQYYNTADNTLWWWDGAQWVSSRGGAAATPPATATALGTVQLAGDLAGTAAAPQIAAGVIVPADVNPLNVDGLAAAASLRTLGSGPGQAMDGTSTLDQIPVAIGPVDLGGQVINNVGPPVAPTDAANKAYVDSMAQGLDTKASVRAATTGNVVLTGPQTVDGVAITTERVLVKNQTNAVENGIYDAAAGAWTRAQDMDDWLEVPSAFTFVEEGATNADTGWVSTADTGGTIDTTAMPWTQFSSAGSVGAGAGMIQVGSTLDVVAAVGGGLVVTADDIGIAPAGVTDAMLATPKAGYYSSAVHAAGTSIAIPQATHLLRAAQGLLVQVQDAASGVVVQADVAVAANGDATIGFGAAVAANAYRVTLVG